MDNELNNIKKRYEKRKQLASNNWKYGFFAQCEREFYYSSLVKEEFNEIKKIKIIEIGAGTGSNLLFFHRLGISFKNIFGNELLEDRGEVLKQNLQSANIFIGDATQLPFKEDFDIVFQSTVFTSILDFGFKKNLAKKMWEMVKNDGIILWYDFKYDNPQNKDVKGIGKTEIRKLFPDNKGIDFYNVTLAPPIGRRIGMAYNIVNFLFPFLRTHLIAVIKK